MALTLDGTLGETFPSWTTGTRPASPSAGQTGYNTTLSAIEAYNGSSWVIGGLPAPSTSGNLLTSDGTNWTSAALNASSITTLASNVSVGTGTSFTISGLTLTNYKFLFLSIVNATAIGTNAYLAIGGTPSLNTNFAMLGTAYSTWASVILDLSAQTQGPSGTSSRYSFASGITTASTSITVNMAVSSFVTGTYYLYGMK
jgi:hypothetical protein